MAVGLPPRYAQNQVEYQLAWLGLIWGTFTCVVWALMEGDVR